MAEPCRYATVGAGVIGRKWPRLHGLSTPHAGRPRLRSKQHLKLITVTCSQELRLDWRKTVLSDASCGHIK
jgi:hypothetical protein